MLGGVILPGILRARQGEVQTIRRQTDVRATLRRQALMGFIHSSI